MATNDIGRVTPIWRGFFSPAITYELNDIVIDTAGSVWWHKSAEITTGIAPSSGEIWDAVIDMAAFGEEIQAAIDEAQAAVTRAETAAEEIEEAEERATDAADAAQTASAAAIAAVDTIGTYATAAQTAKAAAETAQGKAEDAQEAAEAAEDAATEANTAAQTAKAAAETAQGLAEDAQEAAEAAVESVSASAAQIATNAGDISNLKTQTKKLSGKSRFDTVHWEEMPFVILGAMPGTGKWVEHTTATSSVAKIPEWAVSVEMTYEKTTYANVAFFNSFTDPVDGATPDYSEGFTNRFHVDAGEVVKYDIADDMHYLYWQQKGTTNVYMRPTVYFIGNVTEELVRKGLKEAAALSYTEKRAASYEFDGRYWTGDVGDNIGTVSSTYYIRTKYRLPLEARSRISLGNSAVYTMQVFNTVRGGTEILAKHGWSSEDVFVDPNDFEGGCTAAVSFGRIDGEPLTDDDKAAIEAAFDIYYFFPTDDTLTDPFKAANAKSTGDAIQEALETAIAVSYDEKRASSYLFRRGFWDGEVGENIRTGGSTGTKNARTQRLVLAAKSRVTINHSADYEMRVFVTERGSSDVLILAKYEMSAKDIYVDPADYEGDVAVAVNFKRTDGGDLTEADLAAIAENFDIYYISGYNLTTQKTLRIGLEPGTLTPTLKRLYDQSSDFSDFWLKMRTPCFLDVRRCSAFEVTSSFYSVTAVYYDKDYEYITGSAEEVTPNTVYGVDGKTCFIRFIVSNENDAAFDHSRDYLTVVCNGDARIVKAIDNTHHTTDMMMCYVVPGQIGRDHGNTDKTDLDGNAPQCPEITATTGLIRLPPNYDNEGEPVPLIVYAHGSTDYKSKWQDQIRKEGDGLAGHREVIDYLVNEGYAVFDCYGHTDAAEVPSGYGHTYGNADCMNCYIAGIRRCMEVYNLRTDGVYVTGISSGGLAALNLAFNNTIPVLACAPLAPAVDPYGRYLGYNELQRREYAWAMGFEGDADVLIGDGGESPTANSEPAYTTELTDYYTANAEKVIAYNPMWSGVLNVPLSQLIAWSLEPRDDADAEENRNLGKGSMTESNWTDVVRVCKTPVKIWIADDDHNVPPGTIYNFITSLKNGKCLAEKRQVPDGTGGHYAFTSSARTFRQSGKTALGIGYTDIPIYWPEMVAFFRRF